MQCQSKKEFSSLGLSGEGKQYHNFKQIFISTMKSSLIISAMALASAFLLGACSSDDVAGRADSGNQVTFTAKLPTTINTRAYSDGTTVDSVSCYIYQKVDEGYVYATKKTVLVENLGAEITLNLMKGETYAAIFWAQSKDAPYTFDTKSATMSMNYLAKDANEAVANDETRDAFYYRLKDFKVEGSTSTEVDLYRPFAQLNIGASDVAAAKASGYIFTKAQVKTSTYTALDLLTGEPSGDLEEITFANATFPSKLNSDAQTFPITDESVAYEYLSMNYLLVSDKQELRDVVLTMTPDEGSTFSNVKEFTYSNVPVNRNYRTNIYGTLFTEQVKYKIAVKQKFNTPDYNVTYQAATAEELVSALEEVKDGDIVIANEDMDVSEVGPLEIAADITFEVPEGTTVTTARQELETGSSANFVVSEGATVTIDGGGTFSGDNRIVDVDGTLIVNNATFETFTTTKGSAITVNEGGNLTVNEGTVVKAANFALWIDGTATFNGGSITTSSAWVGHDAQGSYCLMLENENTNVTINDGYFQGGKGVIGVESGTVTVNGGVFHVVSTSAHYWYPIYVAPETTHSVTINGGYFYSSYLSMYHLTDGENPTDFVINGGYFNNQGNLDTDKNPVNNPASGYEWKILEDLETISAGGYELSFGYQVVKSEAVDE
jgi:hypothetical protein